MFSRIGQDDLVPGSPAVEPAYLQLYRSGELHRRAEFAIGQLENCSLCAHECGSNRLNTGNNTLCRSGRNARLASGTPATIESPLGGKARSGLIRLAGCVLDCEYCQFWQSKTQAAAGPELDASQLAELMLSRQSQGACNINIMQASHVAAQILEALVIACDSGLKIPLVYNSGGYDSLETLQLLDGVVDIYAVEVKYGNNSLAEKYSRADNYVEYSHIALREMHRQVGDLIIDEDGIARRGLIVRHLVLPANQASTKKVFSFISADISPDTYINLMDDYQPHHRAFNYDKLDRPVTEQEIRQAIRCGTRCGLHRMDLHMSRPWTTI